MPGLITPVGAILVAPDHVVEFFMSTRNALAEIVPVTQTCSITHAVPADQPHSVQEIAETLYPAYTVEGGRVSMAGWGRWKIAWYAALASGMATKSSRFTSTPRGRRLPASRWRAMSPAR